MDDASLAGLDDAQRVSPCKLTPLPSPIIQAIIYNRLDDEDDLGDPFLIKGKFPFCRDGHRCYEYRHWNFGDRTLMPCLILVLCTFV
jgi:hypothetical protein